MRPGVGESPTLDEVVEHAAFACQWPRARIARALLAVGINPGPVGGLADTLRAAEAVSPAVEAIRHALPNIEAVCAAFADAACLSSHLQDLTTPDLNLRGYDSKDRVSREFWVPGLLAQLLPWMDDPKWNDSRRLLLELAGLTWVAVAATRLFPKEARRSPDLNAPIYLGSIAIASNMFHRDDDGCRATIPALSNGIVAWAAAASALKGPFWRTSPLDLVNALRTLELPATAPEPTTASPPTSDLGEPYPYPDLNERDLLQTHWTHPTPSEQKALVRLIRDGVKDTVELQATALALATCRTIRDAVRLSVVSKRDITKFHGECIVAETAFHPSSGFLGAHFAFLWRRAEHREGEAECLVALPHHLSGWLKTLMSPSIDRTIADVLGESPSDLEARAVALLADKLGTSGTRVRILLRDSMARFIFAETANAVVANFWRNPSGPDRGHLRYALSHYVEIRGERAIAPYQRAYEAMAGRFDSGGIPSRVDVPIRSTPLDPTELIQIRSTWLRQIEGLTDLRGRHHSFAAFSLFTLIASTGHRPSKTPFSFAWDFHLQDKLVFISDKLVVGSEARFVPLCESALDQLKIYVRHLRWLSRQTDDIPPAVRAHAMEVCRWLEDRPNDSVARATKAQPFPFFTWLPGRDHPVPLRTHEINKALGIHVRRLRTTIADFLWHSPAGDSTQVLSGREVQTFLGHHPEMHAFGPNSTWSVESWASRIRPILEQYTSTYGLKPFEPPWCASTSRAAMPPSRQVPAIRLSDYGYEGRKREAMWAESRARAIIKRSISSALIENPGVPLGKRDIGAISETVDAELGGDHLARTKVDQILKREIAARAKRGEVEPDVSPPLFQKVEQGPFDLTFSRLLRSANVFASLWRTTFATTRHHRDSAVVDHFARLAISLVVFEGMLDAAQVISLVGDLSAEGALNAGVTSSQTVAQFFPDGVVLRTRVESRRARFDRVVLPSSPTTLQLLGLRQACTKSTNAQAEDLDVKTIETRIDEWLRELETSGRAEGRWSSPQARTSATNPGWSLVRLCQTFRPYWLLRLPGAVYSIATGENIGPSPSMASMRTLTTTDYRPTPFESIRHSRTSAAITDQIFDRIKSIFDSIFKIANGVFEEANQSHRARRMRLAQCLGSAWPSDIYALTDRQPVVGYLVDFLGRLLEQGGFRKEVLRVSTIQAYFNPVMRGTLRLMWNQDVEAWETEKFKECYDSITESASRKQRRRVRYACMLFHRHLVEDISAPVLKDHIFIREPVRPRQELVAAHQADAWIAALDPKSDDIAARGRVLAALVSGYGLRRREALALEAQDFDEKVPDFLLVHNNRARTLKSLAGRRIIPASANSPATTKLVTGWVRKAASSPTPKRWLFADPTGEQVLADTGAIVGAATRALRTSTGNGNLVLHDVRHTWATRLLAAHLLSEPSEGLTARIKRSVVGDEHEVDRLRSLLPLPPQWPFGVDAIAMAIGHAGVDTLLDTYFLGTFLVQAEAAERATSDVEVTDDQIAALLGFHRSTITQRRRRAQSKSGRAHGKRLRDIVLDELNNIAKPEKARKPIPAKPNPRPIALHPLSVEDVDKLLLYRFENAVSLDMLRQKGKQDFYVNPTEIDSTVDRYRAFVEDTGFSDFEPETSELLRTVSHAQRGTLRVATSRQSFIAKCREIVRNDSEFAEMFGTFLERWRARVNPADPWLVCTSVDEVADLQTFLNAFGLQVDAVDVAVFGDPDDPLARHVHERFGRCEERPSDRASRGPRHVRVMEIGFNVRRHVNSPIPQGRELHRALVVLWAAWPHL